MTFLWPQMLIFLLLVPLAVGFYLRLQKRRRDLAQRYSSLGLVQTGTRRPLGMRRHIPPALFLVGFTILVVALARPHAEVNLPRLEGTVILAFDISGSMAAEDMLPTRMEAAKGAALAFVQDLPSSVQIGIVAFSDSGFTVQAPTNHEDSILRTISRLEPERGTSLAQGILASLNTIAVGLGLAEPGQAEPSQDGSLTPVIPPTGGYDSAMIVLISDGENNMAPDPFAAAQLAAEYGVPIYTVGIGSAAGVTLQVNGFTVHTQLDEATLQGIAQLTGGAYYNAESEADLQKIYQNLTPQLLIKPEEIEITALLAGASILALLVGGIFSLLWFSRLP